MSRILFASYEFHPTTWGGCGVLLRHATDLLLSQGHEVVLLLDIPPRYFNQFLEEHQAELSVPDRCRAYQVDALCDDFAYSAEEVENPFIWKSLRFAHGLRRVVEKDPVDFVEFFEYCGVGYHALVEKRFGLWEQSPVLGIRVHNSVELIDLHEGTKAVDADRAVLYGLEHGGLAHSEATLLPSKSYAERYYLDRYSLPSDAIEISEPPTVRFGRREELPLEAQREVQFFGRIFEFKGVERFVRAALLLLEESPGLDLDFVLIGNDSHDGPDGTSYTDYLRETVPERFRARFIFTGHLGHEELLARFARARFVVFPNRFESFCYAAHEAYEAGVPMLVSDIPAFRNYLREGVEAFYFDGSSIDLARQMKGLVKEPEKAGKLSRGRRLADAPLGRFYEHPRALRPIATKAETTVDVVVVILVPERATDAQLHLTLDAIRGQLLASDEIVIAFDVADSRGAESASAVRWLGATRRMQSVSGKALSLSALAAKDALLILLAGDSPAADFTSLCRGALARNPNMGFAGTWTRDADGEVVVGMVDILPERQPFDRGAQLLRCLIRTQPGALLLEVFEAQAGAYGEIGALWQAEERWGKGCLLAKPKLQLSSVDESPRHDGQLAFLVQSIASRRRRERLSLYALSHGPTGSGATSASSRRPGMDAARAGQIAQEYLDGKTLLRLSLKKLARKLATRFGGRAH